MLHFLALFLSGVVVDPIDHDLQYVAALRTESFYQLSQVQGERLLSRADLTAEQRAQVVVEISKTFAAQALNSRPPKRDEFWQQASDVLDRELRAQPDLSLKVLLQSQLAFIAEQQAEWSIREAEIRSRSDDDWLTARGQLRDAIKKLKQVQQQLDSPQMRRQTTLSDGRLQEINRNVQYQLASAYIDQATSYTSNSRDKTNALTQAMRYLESLASGRDLDDLAWKSRIAQIRCVRNLGQYAQAQKLITKFSAAPGKYIGSLAAESIRLALDADQLEAAMSLVDNVRIDARHPEFQLAKIEAMVQAAEQLKGQPKATELRQRATQTVADLGQQHGVYWALRGETLLSRMAARDGNANSELLSNAAETMLRKDSPEDAKQMFVRAAEQAGGKDDDKAFEFSYKAAIVDHREGKLQPAIDQFRAAAMKYPANAQAAGAHLLGVFDAAGLYQEYAAAKSSLVGRALEQYESLLAEHMHTWPDQKTADQARMWSAKLMLARRKWNAAIELYQGVHEGSEFEAEAYRQLGDSYAKWIVSLRRTEEEIGEQRDWIRSKLKSMPSGNAKSSLAMTAARFAMQASPRDYEFAESTLRTAIGEGTGNLQELGAMLVVATAGNQRAELARTELASIAPLPLEPLLVILRGLEPIRDEQPDDADLRKLTSEVIGLLQPYQDRLSDKDRLVANFAIADYSSTSVAVAKYKQLATDRPEDHRIQRRYAELLSRTNTRETRATALKQWRMVVRQSKKQSPDWFRAKLGVAQSQFDLGERKKAKELIEYLQAIYPELGGPQLSEKFAQLLAVCGR